MSVSSLRAALSTSVVEFGVGAFVMGLGVLFVILGSALTEGRDGLRPAALPEPVAPGSSTEVTPAVASA
jgi:hypothetical protein